MIYRKQFHKADHDWTMEIIKQRRSKSTLKAA